TGPYRVVTELAILGFHPETKRMEIRQRQPGVTIEEIRAATGFELGVAEAVEDNPSPTDEELRLLREEVDPERLYI
ncbi:MAG: hypothetical protein KC591_07550, partial [Gemmatimonadetes bacterium]|nr:hypothetical protein [Gemmatimonadota bacterium]